MLTILLAAHSLDDYSLDDYLSFTSRTQLVGSGSRVAWVERVRGVPNLAGSEDGGPSFPTLPATTASTLAAWS